MCLELDEVIVRPEVIMDNRTFKLIRMSLNENNSIDILINSSQDFSNVNQSIDFVENRCLFNGKMVSNGSKIGTAVMNMCDHSNSMVCN